MKKQWWQSRTLIYAGLNVAAALIPIVQDWISSNQNIYVLGNALAVALLRLITEKPVCLKGS